MTDRSKIIQLLEKGASIPNPEMVDIGEEVATERIAGAGVSFFAGTRIYGEKTYIARGVKLGREAPVTVVNCQLGPHVELKGGFYTASTFLANASMGSNAQLREGCLMEEEANGAHTVGMKQTILFPFVTLGSLINCCDCLVAGGTSRRNHSEVGSSYIHFNYTPNQDKATASLIGDVPRGVMLNQAPIFLGGQGGIVGPVRIGYGTVIAAGTVYRGDCPEGGKLIGQQGQMTYEISFHLGFYADIKRRICNNILYIANILALRQWYDYIRRPFFMETGDGALYEGAVEKLDLIIQERIVRFRALSEKMETSLRISEKILAGERRDVLIRQSREFMENWPAIEASLTSGREADIEPANRQTLQNIIEKNYTGKGMDYTSCIRNLDPAAVNLGVAWLQSIVDDVAERIFSLIPACR
ncbi:MAG: bifunctional UDP-N-acetylglucosamine pyrophosphorylase / glucosamine-phosphate N-acetyltransferase [Thermodesulfobacteriota bacterium]|nr:bifunctional UDP-N-acetylglucosamine pyrophosphorylase / glucosamine-phosphate N-acetyltransferase [Thermodesulfobacteriota bacterium]